MRKSAILQLTMIILIAYSAASVSLLIYIVKWGQSILYSLPEIRTVIVYTIISFALVMLMAAYHLSNLIRRRKRRTDRQAISRAKFIRAKHRLPSRW